MNDKQLRLRWTSETLLKVNKMILAASKRMKLEPMPESPFGLLQDGKSDFRGFIATESIRYMKVTDANLAGATFKDGATISQSDMFNCIFDSADLRGVMIGRSFDRCSFIGARLAGAKIGSSFHDCDFSRSTLNRTTSTGSIFQRCDFSGATMKDILYTHCFFSDCSLEAVKALSGSIAGSRFTQGTSLDLFGDCITDGIKFDR